MNLFQDLKSKVKLSRLRTYDEKSLKKKKDKMNAPPQKKTLDNTCISV